MNYEISKKDDFIKFVRDHGECYGGVRTTVVDCRGKSGIELYKHIKEYAGKGLAVAAKNQGFC